MDILICSQTSDMAGTFEAGVLPVCVVDKGGTRLVSDSGSYDGT